MAAYQELPITVSTLYGELLQQTLILDADRSIGDLKGNFVNKTVRSKVYWYLQYQEFGKHHQVYIGPDSEALRDLIKLYQSEKTKKAPDVELCRRLCSMLLNAGINKLEAINAKVISQLADSGVFKMGAVLVGSHAFTAYSPILGVTWLESFKTHDIDIAHDNRLSLALSPKAKPVDVTDVIKRLDMGFHPVPGFDHKDPSTSFKIRGKELIIDILTPQHGRSEKPVFLPDLNTAAQPLRFLDYLIDDPIQAVIAYDKGILVNMPRPVRYALHKLVVASRRSFVHKAKKDQAQARLLLEILKKLNPDEINREMKILKDYSMTSYDSVARLKII